MGITAPVRPLNGFTLLEILIVMALVALISVVAGPNLQRMVAGIETATQRDALLLDLGALGSRAFTLGQNFELSSATASRLLRDGSPMLVLPPGWRIETEKPIFYNLSGYCGGGDMWLQAPDGARQRLRLTPPHCSVLRRADAA